MSGRAFAAHDIGLVFAPALGVGVWQQIAVRSSIRRDLDGEADRIDRDGRRPLQGVTARRNPPRDPAALIHRDLAVSGRIPRQAQAD